MDKNNLEVSEEEQNEHNHSNKLISEWSEKDVENFLEENELSYLKSTVAEMNINGYDLCKLTEDQLKEMKFSLHDINQLTKAIHAKILEQMQIQISYENKPYNIQLDSSPEQSVESIVSLFTETFDIKEKVLLMTEENQILYPKLNFTKIFLISPNKYSKLKIFSPKEKNSTFDLPSHTLSEPKIDIGTKFKHNYEPLPMSSTTPLANVPEQPPKRNTNITTDYSSYKFERGNLNKFNEGGEQQQIGSMMPTIKGNVDDLMQPTQQEPPQKYQPERIPQTSPTQMEQKYKPYSGLGNMKIGTNRKEESTPTMPKYEYKIDFKKFPSQPNLDPSTGVQGNKTNFSSKFDLIDPSSLGGGLTSKESKDLGDLNNPTTNYMFNSGEMPPSYEGIKKTSKPQGLSQIKDEMSLQPPLMQQKTFGGYMPNPRINAMNTNKEIDQPPTQHKDDFKRFSSEKRTYRSTGSNLIENTNTQLPQRNKNLEDYQPSQYQKYSNSPLDEMADRFTSEKFTKMSTRQQQPSKKEEINFTAGGFKYQSMRGNMGNFDKKGNQGGQFETQREMGMKFKFQNQMGQMEDKDME